MQNLAMEQRYVLVYIYLFEQLYCNIRQFLKEKKEKDTVTRMTTSRCHDVICYLQMANTMDVIMAGQF